jgi:ComF family protein
MLLLYKSLLALIKALVPYFFPHVCLGCEKWSDESVCEACLNTIVLNPATRNLGENVSSALSFYPYEGLLQTIIHDYKFNNIKTHAVVLRRLFERGINAHSHGCLIPLPRRGGGEADGVVLPIPYPYSLPLILPVPTHPKRKKKRGFDHISLIFSPLLKEKGYELSSAVRRCKNTPFLHALSKEDRQKTIKGAFEVVDLKAIEGKTVVIVDDILTSGSTVKELAKVLKGAGVGSVMVVTLGWV